MPFLLTMYAVSEALADPTVDVVNGGLLGASVVLSSRFGVPIDFEEPPLGPTELGVCGQEGHYTPERRHREVRFSYPGGADVDQALAALVAAWEALGGPGSPYRVEAHGAVRRLVPTTRTLPDGRREPWVPLLDDRCTLHLPAIEVGWPEHRLVQWLTAMRDTCGVSSIEWLPYAMNAPTDGEFQDDPIPPSWAFPEFRGTPRDALDELSRIVGGGQFQVLQQVYFAPGHEPRYFLMFHLSGPADEWRANRTPLGRPATPDRRPPEFAPLSWDQYVAWWHAHPEAHRHPQLEPDWPIEIPVIQPHAR